MSESDVKGSGEPEGKESCCAGEERTCCVRVVVMRCGGEGEQCCDEKSGKGRCCC